MDIGQQGFWIGGHPNELISLPFSVFLIDFKYGIWKLEIVFHLTICFLIEI